MNKLILILILLLSFKTLWAQLSGDLDGDTLRADLSPYHVVGNVNVIDLVIEPGVTILFDDDYRFEVNGNGKLRAQGFYNDSIYFKPDTNNSNGWRGINLRRNSLASILNYCRIEGSSDYGIKVDECEPPTISNCKIVNNTGNGLETKKLQNQIRNCSIENNGNNGVFLDQASTTIFNSIITKNINTGILSNDATDSLIIINSVIADHQGGTGILSLDGYVNIKNSIIYWNQIELSSDPNQTFITYSDIRRTPVYPGTGNINSLPQFNDLLIYTLAPGVSPCIDSGDPDSLYDDIYFPPSLSTSRNDMGAYGGPLAGEWYPPIYIQPDSLIFGKVSYDSTVTLKLNVKNYRDSIIITDSIYFAGNDTSIFNSDKDNLNINVLDSSSINISFTPDRQDYFFETLIFKTVNHGKFFVPITGRGVVSEINYVKNQLDFETVALGDSSVLDFPIINSGDDTLKIFQIYTSNSNFTVSASYMNINPNPSRDTLYVTFIPDSIDMLSDSLILITNDPDEGRVSIPLFGQGVGPIIDINNEPIDFGSVHLMRDSVKTLSINNAGNESLYITNIQVIINDTISDSFRLLNDSLVYPIMIDSFSTYELDIVFEPTVLNEDSAIIIIEHNDALKPEIDISLAGIGIASIIEPNKTVVEFGVIPFNTIALDTITIYNSGNYSLNINPDSLLFTGFYSQFFSVDSIGSYQIPAGNSTDLIISFYAGEEGIKQDSLQIVSNDLTKPKIMIAVSGESRLPQITFSDTLFNFDDVLIDSVKSLFIKIYNNGQGKLLILEDSLRISGTDSMYFEIDSIDKYEINPSDSAYLEMEFNALKAGQNEAVLNLLSNDLTQSPKSFNLSGFVLTPLIKLSQTTVDFDTIPLLNNKTDTLKIYNSGQEVLTVFYDSLNISGLDSQFFSIDTIISNGTLQPDDSAQIILNYTSSDTGKRNAELVIYSNDQILPEIPIYLTGTSLAPEIDIPYTSIDFGMVPAGFDSVFTLKIYNNGLGKLILNKEGLKIRGKDSSLFIIDDLDSNVIIKSMDSIAVDIVFNSSITGPKSAYLQIICNDIDEQLKSIDLISIAIDAAPASIVLDENHSSQELVFDQNGNLRFFINAYSFPDSVILNYRQGGSTLFSKHNLNDLGQLNMWEIAIDSSWITTKGFEYFIRAYHGWRTTDWPNKTKSMQVLINYMQFPETTQKEVYQKISIPFDTKNQTLNELFADDLGSYDDTKYRFFDCENGSSYTEIRNLDKMLPAGKSIWLITKDDIVLDFTKAKTLPTDTIFQLSLHSGWNMISTPFAFPINWDENDPNHKLRFYDGSDWPFVSVLEPFKGYAVQVNSDTVIYIQPKEYTATNKLTKTPLFLNADWTINLKVEQNKLRDHFNYAGIKENAKEGIDRFDHREPPPIGDFVSLYFTQENKISGNIEKFSTDFKNNNSQGYVYDFEVTGNVSGKKRINIETNSLPQNYSYCVINPASKIKYDDSSFNLFSSFTKMQLIVGSKEFVDDKTANYKSIPSSFMLNQNYPNPFNPNTTIEFQVPGFTKLSIDIYNILGQKVKSLLNNVEKDAGYYKVNWDATNNNGHAVASGIYFLIFRSTKFNKSIKMLVQR